MLEVSEDFVELFFLFLGFLLFEVGFIEVFVVGFEEESEFIEFFDDLFSFLVVEFSFSYFVENDFVHEDIEVLGLGIVGSLQEVFVFFFGCVVDFYFSDEEVTVVFIVFYEVDEVFEGCVVVFASDDLEVGLFCGDLEDILGGGAEVEEFADDFVCCGWQGVYCVCGCRDWVGDVGDSPPVLSGDPLPVACTGRGRRGYNVVVLWLFVIWMLCWCVTFWDHIIRTH